MEPTCLQLYLYISSFNKQKQPPPPPPLGRRETDRCVSQLAASAGNRDSSMEPSGASCDQKGGFTLVQRTLFPSDTRSYDGTDIKQTWICIQKWEEMTDREQHMNRLSACSPGLPSTNQALKSSITVFEMNVRVYALHTTWYWSFLWGDIQIHPGFLYERGDKPKPDLSLDKGDGGEV